MTNESRISGICKKIMFNINTHLSPQTASSLVPQTCLASSPRSRLGPEHGECQPGAVLVDRKKARLTRPIVREALEALEPREKPVAAEGMHGEYLERRGRLLR